MKNLKPWGCLVVNDESDPIGWFQEWQVKFSLATGHLPGRKISLNEALSSGRYVNHNTYTHSQYRHGSVIVLSSNMNMWQHI